MALEGVGITAPFPIQSLALPVALGGHDIIGQARTGTGKTLAFGIPLLQHLADTPASEPTAPPALVVVPTRELASQVAEDLRVASVALGTRVLTVYGGRAYEPQIDALRNGVDIVVGTPGRLLDLVGQRHLNLSAVRALVLDEADKMLDLGFLPDVERILERTPAERQTMLFSATMPGEVVTLARRHLRQPLHVRAEQHDEPDLVPLTVQHVFRAHQMDKIEMLARILQANGRGLSHGVLPDQAVRGPGGRGADDARLRRRRGARRPRPGPAGAGAAGVPQRQDRRAGGHRRGVPRAGRGRRHARDQLRVPGRRQGLPAPHRAHRAGRPGRHRGDVRGLVATCRAGS